MMVSSLIATCHKTCSPLGSGGFWSLVIIPGGACLSPPTSYVDFHLPSNERLDNAQFCRLSQRRTKQFEMSHFVSVCLRHQIVLLMIKLLSSHFSAPVLEFNRNNFLGSIKLSTWDYGRREFKYNFQICRVKNSPAFHLALISCQARVVWLEGRNYHLSPRQATIIWSPCVSANLWHQARRLGSLSTVMIEKF